MEKIWKGAFSPVLRKHRDYCGDILNHIDNWEVVRTYDELTETEEITVIVGFIDGDETEYEYPMDPGSYAELLEARRAGPEAEEEFFRGWMMDQVEREFSG